jgi:hypothetical protein
MLYIKAVFMWKIVSLCRKQQTLLCYGTWNLDQCQYKKRITNFLESWNDTSYKEYDHTEYHTYNTLAEYGFVTIIYVL